MERVILFGEHIIYYIDWVIPAFAHVPNTKKLILSCKKSLKNFIETLDTVQSEHPGQKIEVWFQDEARFGQQGTITRVWALRGSRPRVVRQTKYEWLYVIGFHTSKDLKVPENITIVPLPAYSPELNPVENLWLYLRSHYWANRSYANYDDLRYATIDAWQNAALDPEIIKSVCRASYAERNN